MYCGTETASKDCANWPPKSGNPSAPPKIPQRHAPPKQQKDVAREAVARGDAVWKVKAASLTAELSGGLQGESEGSGSDAMGGSEDGDGGGWPQEQVSALQVMDSHLNAFLPCLCFSSAELPSGLLLWVLYIGRGGCSGRFSVWNIQFRSPRLDMSHALTMYTERVYPEHLCRACSLLSLLDTKPHVISRNKAQILSCL